MIIGMSTSLLTLNMKIVLVRSVLFLMVVMQVRLFSPTLFFWWQLSQWYRCQSISQAHRQPQVQLSWVEIVLFPNSTATHSPIHPPPPNYPPSQSFTQLIAKLSSVKFTTSQIELRLALLSLYSHPAHPTLPTHPTRASIFEPLLDHLRCWNLVWRLYLTKQGQIATS